MVVDVSAAHLALPRGPLRQPLLSSFTGNDTREHCEGDHSLGYELLKRMSLVMNQRMQAARNTMLAIHHRTDILPPVRLSPFRDRNYTHPGADDDR